MYNKEPYRIVVGYDFSSLADRAIEEAFDQASRHKKGEVHVVSVQSHAGDYVGTATSVGMGMAPMPATPTHEMLRERIDMMLEEWLSKDNQAFAKLEVHSRSDMAAAGVLEMAEDLDASLIVVGTHARRGLKRMLFGSVAEEILRGAHCPVHVVPVEHDELQVPAIEPPCPQCVEERFRTGGKVQWCQRHREHHAFGHGYHYESRVGKGSKRPIL